MEDEEGNFNPFYNLETEVSEQGQVSYHIICLSNAV